MKWLTLAFALLAAPLMAQDRLLLGATTTLDNSGLLGELLPQFTADTGFRVDTVVLGTRQILAMAERGEFDVLIVHHRPSELAFMAAGYGAARHDLMFNDFMLIGPVDDPAATASARDVSAALAAIATAQARFISRGDESGTHLRELELWAQAGIAPSGAWYFEVGAGMGATLNIVAALSAYTLSDRATWLTFQRQDGLALLFEGGAGLRNDYSLIEMNAERFAHINTKAAQAFASWMLGPKGQGMIAAYRPNGQQLFCAASQHAGQQQSSETCAANAQ
ncbi:MAG: substrate-binding domain-containing protein [Paracoccaceae bacterium]